MHAYIHHPGFNPAALFGSLILLDLESFALQFAVSNWADFIESLGTVQTLPPSSIVGTPVDLSDCG